MTCYRHPDREAYVRCQRCERFICPECQVEASVGFLCPDDAGGTVTQLNRRRTRAARIRQSGPRPVVSLSLIGANIFFWLLQIMPGSYVTDLMAYVPQLTGLQPWRMISAGFVHNPANFLHLLLNMYSLYIFGQVLEPMLGRALPRALPDLNLWRLGWRLAACQPRQLGSRRFGRSLRSDGRLLRDPSPARPELGPDARPYRDQPCLRLLLIRGQLGGSRRWPSHRWRCRPSACQHQDAFAAVSPAPWPGRCGARPRASDRVPDAGSRNLVQACATSTGKEKPPKSFDRAVFEFLWDYFQRVDIPKPTMAMPKPIRMFQFWRFHGVPAPSGNCALET